MEISIGLNGVSISDKAPAPERHKGKSLIDFPDNYVVFDLETTGLSPRYDSIIEIGAIKVCDNEPVEKFSSLVQPDDFYIDEFITELTGITDEMLRSAPGLADTLSEFKKFVGSSVLVGHNVNFDINFIYDSFMECFGTKFQNNFIDTLRLSKKIVPDIRHHGLDDLAAYYDLGGRELHRALGDCELTMLLYNALRSDCISKFDSFDDFKSSFARKSYTLNANDITAQTDSFDESHPLFGKTCVFTGTLELMVRKDAMQLVANLGGINGNSVTKSTDFLILGNNDYCASIKGGKSNKQKKAEEMILKGHHIQIMPESVFYEMVNYQQDLNK